ncbi:MAG: hypothetical protein M1829_003262 [Trizodia sp. TS-e1964]|nr:MAG: hypothetical protein M1829_003262 [Trizodia sp. TS-e1964]
MRYPAPQIIPISDDEEDDTENDFSTNMEVDDDPVVSSAPDSPQLQNRSFQGYNRTDSSNSPDTRHQDTFSFRSTQPAPSPTSSQTCSNRSFGVLALSSAGSGRLIGFRSGSTAQQGARQLSIIDIENFSTDSDGCIDPGPDSYEESTSSYFLDGQGNQRGHELEYMTDEELKEAILNYNFDGPQRYTKKGLTQRGKAANPFGYRNPSIVSPFAIEERLLHQSGNLVAGRTVELQDQSFLRIKYIIKDLRTDEVSLRGDYFRPCTDSEFNLPKERNEVCWALDIDMNDFRADTEQSMREVSLGEVKKIRGLRLTNQIYPKCSFRDDGLTLFGASNGENLVLVCRWKWIRYFKNPTDRHKGLIHDRALIRLAYEESDPKYAVDDATIRADWRGATPLGGSHFTKDPPANSQLGQGWASLSPFQSPSAPKYVNDFASGTNIFMGDPWKQNTLIQNRQKYSFGDAFCGGGGASRGAEMGNVNISWGFDNDQDACKTYYMNFPNADVHICSVTHFLETLECVQVDMMHISPPCQYFSNAHTVEGKDDEANTATILSIDNLLKKVKPRVITIENTAGLFLRHHAWMGKLISMITSVGFSVRWKLINCAEYGAPQKRMRIFAIGSWSLSSSSLCPTLYFLLTDVASPGEALPSFPDPTHSDDIEVRRRTGLKPFVSVNKAIGNIALDSQLHNLAEVQGRNLPPYSADLPLPRCITTCGGQNFHPSGKRDFTVREFASLQAFPLHHIFGKKKAKRQIGNAVPPVVMEVFVKHIVRALREADGVREEIVLD